MLCFKCGPVQGSPVGSEQACCHTRIEKQTSVCLCEPGVQPGKVPEAADDVTLTATVLLVGGACADLVADIRLQAPPACQPLAHTRVIVAGRARAGDETAAGATQAIQEAEKFARSRQSLTDTFSPCFMGSLTTMSNSLRCAALATCAQSRPTLGMNHRPKHLSRAKLHL